MHKYSMCVYSVIYVYIHIYITTNANFPEMFTLRLVVFVLNTQVNTNHSPTPEEVGTEFKIA